MTDGFFAEKKAAAMFKHGILDRYVDPFAMKTGSTSQNGRVAFIDGYAGEGRYDDGAEGSPALLMAKATKLAPRRQLEIHLVEEDDKVRAKLDAVVAAEGAGVCVTTYPGDVADHLDTLLTRVKGIPVFVFLDPYGLMIPFDAVAEIFNGRAAGLGAPATEVLINFTAMGLRRIAGHLYSATPNAATLSRMDGVCGGDGWRAEWLSQAPSKESSDAAKTKAEDAVVNGYAARLAKATGAGYWTTEVRNASHLKPVYHLVFVTRHRDGLRVFGEVMSSALAEWRRVVWDQENAGSLFEGEDAFKASEAALEASWVDEIEKNLRQCLTKYGAFRVRDHYSEVFGSALGTAREMHLRAAWKRLHADGTTTSDSKGSPLIDKIIQLS
jgi:three-Cys-motif partner protein